VAPLARAKGKCIELLEILTFLLLDLGRLMTIDAADFDVVLALHAEVGLVQLAVRGEDRGDEHGCENKRQYNIFYHPFPLSPVLPDMEIRAGGQ
jgi:hypothetical protein